MVKRSSRVLIFDGFILRGEVIKTVTKALMRDKVDRTFRNY
jgi:hypothetical protein